MNKSTIALLTILTIGCMFIAAAQTQVINMQDWVKIEIVSPIESNGAIPVNIQDQTSRPFAVKVNQIINSNINLTDQAVIGSYDINVTAGHGIVAGDEITILEQNGIARLWYGTVQAVNVNTITMDSPAPNNFTTTNSTIFEYTPNLNVDGSTTTQVFGITNFFADPVDITRVLFHCSDATAMDDGKFCGGTALDRGVVFRKQLITGEYVNYWTAKENGDFRLLAYDLDYNDKAPAGEFGMAMRLTYGGQNKHGVVIRLEPGERIELLVQDDLTGLTDADFVLEGHFTQDE